MAEHGGASPERPQPPEVGPEEYSRRLEMGRGWIADAATVATLTGDQEAQELVVFAEDHVGLDIPLKGNTAKRYHLSDDTRAGLMPVTIEDHNDPGNYAYGLYDRPNIAHFGVANSTIQVLEDVPMSTVWRGVVLLHELRHAKEWTSERYDFDDPEEFARRERDVFTFEFRLLHSAGGAAYEELLNEKAAIIKSRVEPDGRLVIPFDQGPYDERMDHAFGDALSDRERMVRKSVLHMDAVFTAFDGLYPEDPETEKLRYIRKLYGK